MPAKDDAQSATKSAVAPGTIDIRENPMQDISALSRDTANALNELGRIFDKKTVEEQQELAAVFGEEAFRLAHNLTDDGSGMKTAVHLLIGGIMSRITGAGFASGAIGAGVNEAVINEIAKIEDPGTAQIVSAIIGAAAAKAIGGNAGAGAVAAASGTKNNHFAIPLLAEIATVGVEEAFILTSLCSIMGWIIQHTDEGEHLLKDATGDILAKWNNLGEWFVRAGEETFDYVGVTVEELVFWASKGTPRNNKAQNEQARSAANKHGLNHKQRRQLHDEIHKQNYGYREIEEIAKRIKDGEL